MNPIIRHAEEKDIPFVANLLYQVQAVHAEGRPDLFRRGGRKYSDAKLREIFSDPTRPVLVAELNGTVVGYAFCILETTPGSDTRYAEQSLYIDDLCVDTNRRGNHIGTVLYNAVRDLAQQFGCARVTLNVWSLNESAMKFYEKCGMQPLKVTMEQIL